MIDLENTQKQDEWLGIVPGSQLRMIIAVATFSSLVILIILVSVQYFVGFTDALGGLFVGILSGLLVSGLLASFSWLVYEQFLPIYLHRKFRPRIDGRWFGYYYEEYPDGSKCFVEEYIYIIQVANKISGTILEHSQQEFYLFNGQLIPGTLIINWQPQNQMRNMVGAIILNPRGDMQWEGIQVFGGQSGKFKHMHYLMSKFHLSEAPPQAKPNHENDGEQNQQVVADETIAGQSA